VYQRTGDYPGEWANGHHVMLDSEELVTVRWDQVEEGRLCRRDGLRRSRSLQQHQGQLCRFSGVIEGIVGLAPIK
jgi:hypothetical protein